jgi:GTP-binding protein HflX
LQRKLEEIVAQRAQRRRRRAELPRFALVGYTNAGKSTLMRTLTAASVFVEDRLFATLDTTVRRFRLPGGQPALLSDTVGFLRNLPPQLIASFHSTLAEAIEADVLVHVVDISHPSFRQHMQVVTETLHTLAIATKPTVLVFNKIDRLPADSPLLRELRSEYPEAVFISAERGINIRKLLATLQRVYDGQSEELAFVLPYTELHLLRHLRTSGQILQQEAFPDGLLVRLRCPLAIGQRLRGQYASYVYPAGMLNA